MLGSLTILDKKTSLIKPKLSLTKMEKAFCSFPDAHLLLVYIVLTYLTFILGHGVLRGTWGTGGGVRGTVRVPKKQPLPNPQSTPTPTPGGLPIPLPLPRHKYYVLCYTKKSMREVM